MPAAIKYNIEGISAQKFCQNYQINYQYIISKHTITKIPVKILAEKVLLRRFTHKQSEFAKMNKSKFEKEKEKSLRELHKNLQDIDTELVELIFTLNKIQGLYTLSCCVGHGKDPCRIWFKIENFEILHKFCFNCLDVQHQHWNVCYDIADINREDHKVFYIETKTKDMKVIQDLVKCLNKSIQGALGEVGYVSL